MSERSFIEALDEALELLEQGYPFEYCVQRFPEYADRLRPLLQVGDDLRRLSQASKVSLEMTRVDPDWETLLANVPQSPPQQVGSIFAEIASRWRVFFGSTAQRYALLAATLLFLFVLGSAATFFNLTRQHQPDIVFASAIEELSEIREFAEQSGQPPSSQMFEQALGQVQDAVEAAKESEDQSQLQLHLSTLLKELTLIDQIKAKASASESDSFNQVDKQIAQLRSDLQQIVVQGTPAPRAMAVTSATNEPASTTGLTTPTSNPSRQEDESASLKEEFEAGSKVPPSHPPASELVSETPTVPAEPVAASEPTPAPGDESTLVPTETPVPTDAPTEAPVPPTETPVPTDAPTEAPVPSTETPVPPETPTLVPTVASIEPAMSPETPVPSTETPTPMPTDEPVPVPSPSATASSIE